MSWREGAKLFIDIWPAIQRRIPEAEFRHEFVRDLVVFFTNCDVDGADLRRINPEIDHILDELNEGNG